MTYKLAKYSHSVGVEYNFVDLISILQWQVNKMGGEIKVVKKEGPGTLMRLYLLLSTPMDEQHCQIDYAENGLVVSTTALFLQITSKYCL